jgi:polysaccharide export outer membrane protein
MAIGKKARKRPKTQMSGGAVMQTVRIRRIWHALVAVVFMCFWPAFLAGQSKAESETRQAVAAKDSAQAVEAPGPGTTLAELAVGPADLVDVSLFGVPDFHAEARVNNAGDISLPLVGALHVAGLSPVRVEELIAKKLVDGNFYKNPQVSVMVKEYSTQGLYVLGEVQKPGLYSVLQAHSLLQAISLAGGTTPKAGRKVTITNSSRENGQLVAVIGGDSASAQDVKVLPGDTIVVSKAGVVYVVGDVHLPSGIVMEHDNLTVLQAIALAQGTNPSAALDHSKLIRRSAEGPKQMDLPLKKMLALRTQDITVQAEDIIFVPTSTAKAFSKRGLEAVVQAATGVAMYSRF